MTDFHFLFFSYYYPPALGTAARRNYRISAAISKRAATSHLFTSASGLRKDAQESDIRIRTIPAIDYRSFLRRKTKDGALPESKKQNPWMQNVIRWINSYPLNILIGEGGLVYFLNLLRQGNRLIKNNQITHLYSSYRPFADHYAAYWLKKRNPQIFWIADFRDLMIDPHYNHIHFPKSHQAFFKKIFSTADLLTTVSDGLAKKLLEYNPKVITLRNGIENEIVQVKPVASDFFTIAYTGSMFLNKRNSRPLLIALKDCIAEGKMDQDKIRIVYAGKDFSYWKNLTGEFKMDSILINHGIIPGEKAIEVQRNACINVLLTVSSDELQGVLTGKMIEYFEAGSPVLGLVVGQNDPELQSILRELEIGDSFSDQPHDLLAIKEFIYKEYLNWEETGMNRKPVNAEILKRKYSMDSLMSPLFQYIESHPVNH